MKKDIYKKCCLCPSREGALKPTDTGGWAHVVCALYIQEVSFGDMAALEPIIVTNVPKERFKQTCSICTERQQNHLAGQGACMSCAKVGCKSAFHVTCAQEKGFLFEEFVNNNNNSLSPGNANGENNESNSSSNVAYRGYCAVHITKLRNSGRIKRSSLASAAHKTLNVVGTEVHRPISSTTTTAISSPVNPHSKNNLSYSTVTSGITQSFDSLESHLSNANRNNRITHPNPLLSGHDLNPNLSGIFSSSRKLQAQNNSPTSPISFVDRNQVVSYAQRSPPVSSSHSTFFPRSAKLSLSDSFSSNCNSMAAASTSVLTNGGDFKSANVSKSTEKQQQNNLNSHLNNHILSMSATTQAIGSTNITSHHNATSARCGSASSTSLVPPNGFLKSSGTATSNIGISNGDANLLLNVSTPGHSPRVPKNGVSYVPTSNNNSFQYHNANLTQQQQANYNSSGIANDSGRLKASSASSKSGAPTAASLKRAEKMAAGRKNSSNAQQNGPEVSSPGGAGNIPPPLKKQRMKTTTRRSTGSSTGSSATPDFVGATPETSLPGVPGKRVKSSNSVSGGSPHLSGLNQSQNLPSPRLMGLSTSALSSPGINPTVSFGSENNLGAHMSPLLTENFVDGRKLKGISGGPNYGPMSSDSDQFRKQQQHLAAAEHHPNYTNSNNNNPNSALAINPQLTHPHSHPTAAVGNRNAPTHSLSSQHNSPFIPNSAPTSGSEHKSGLPNPQVANQGGGHSLNSMVSLLEEQWNQGSQFLMLQGKKYNIPSLLSSLYDLQTENRQLEGELTDITSKRKQLHLMNQQLAVPLSTTSNSIHAAATGSQGGLGSTLQIATNGTGASGLHAGATGGSNVDVVNVAALSSNGNGSHSSMRVPSRSKSGMHHDSNSFFPGSNHGQELNSQIPNANAMYDHSSSGRLNGPSGGSVASGHGHSVNTYNRRTPTTTPLQSPISASISGQNNPGSSICSAQLPQNSQQVPVSPSAADGQQQQQLQNQQNLIISTASSVANLNALVASRSTPNSAASAVTASIVQQQQQQQQQIAAAQLAAAAAQVSYLDPSATYSLLAQQQLVAYHRALGISQTSPQQTQSTTSPVVDQIAQSYRLAAAAAASGLDGTTQVLLNPAMLNTLFTPGPTTPR